MVGSDVEVEPVTEPGRAPVAPQPVVDYSGTAFGQSEVGQQVLALVPSVDQSGALPESLPQPEGGVRVQVLEIRALIGRLRVLPPANGSGASPTIDSELVDILDADILRQLEEEMDPTLVDFRERERTVERLQQLLAEPDVLNGYAEIYNKIAKEIALYRTAKRIFNTPNSSESSRTACVRQMSRSLNTLVRWCEDEKQNVHNQVRRERRGLLPSDRMVLDKLKNYVGKCGAEMELLHSNMAAAIQMRSDKINLNRSILFRNVAEEEKERNGDLSAFGYIVTESRSEFLYGNEKSPDPYIMAALRARQNVELYGPTGTGKTKLAVEAGRVFSGKDPMLMSCHIQTNRYDFWGSKTGLDKRDVGALAKCLIEGRVLILDEDNMADTRVMAIMKFALGLERGDRLFHPDTAEEMLVPEGFGVIAARNEKSSVHNNRQSLPPEYRREYNLASFEVGYFPADEIYDDFLIPKLTNEDGSMNLTQNDVGGRVQADSATGQITRSPLLAFVLAAEKAQELYCSHSIKGGVVDVKYLINFFGDWDEQFQKTKCSFLEFIEVRLLRFVKAPGLTKVDRKKLIEAFVSEGFFQTMSAADFKPLEEPEPIDQATLDSWRGAGVPIFASDPNAAPLSRDDVALLDPFGKRTLELVPHALDAEIEVFRSVYVPFCRTTGILPVTISARTLASQKANIVKGLKDYLEGRGGGADFMLAGTLNDSLDSTRFPTDEAFLIELARQIALV